jgi:DNA primase
MSAIMTYIETKGLHLKRNGATHGGEFVGPCPFCKDGTDRFHVWPAHAKRQGGGYWCRACRASGDFCALLMKLDGLTYPQACQAAGIEAKQFFNYAKPRQAGATRPEEFAPSACADPTELWQEHALKFVDQAHAALMADPAALLWLETQRGLGTETVERFRLGMNRTDAYRARESWGLPTEIKEETGKPKKLWIPRGLVIPCFESERLQRIRIRRPKAALRSDSDPRYFVVPGSSAAIMRIGDHRSAYVIVESELDALLIAQEAGDLAGVVAMGTSASKPDVRTYPHLSAASILLAAQDSDAAGEKGSLWWMQTFPRSAERWPMPVGKDPGDAFGAIDVRTWVLAGLPPGSAPSDHSPLPCDLGGGANLESSEPGADEPATTPETVLELGALLAKYPVRVIANAHRFGIEEGKNWHDWEVSRRISFLVFFDPDCGRHLVDHPEEVITGRNFWRS